jgi:16S rRNA (guanine527-N7)-methyltransferase
MEKITPPTPKLLWDSTLIQGYFPGLTAVQKTQFAKLGELYLTWNSRLNLISRNDMPHLYLRHVLHSLAIAKVISFAPGTKVLDVGTGGGFPGIPLAILFPETSFFLVDSIGKKQHAVAEMVQAVGLCNVQLQRIRAEQLSGKYDFVLARAVAALPTFYRWVKDKMNPKSSHELANGILYLKGGDFAQELALLPCAYELYPIARYFSEPFFVQKQVVHLFPKRR